MSYFDCGLEAYTNWIIAASIFSADWLNQQHFAVWVCEERPSPLLISVFAQENVSFAPSGVTLVQQKVQENVTTASVEECVPKAAAHTPAGRVEAEEPSSESSLLLPAAAASSRNVCADTSVSARPIPPETTSDWEHWKMFCCIKAARLYRLTPAWG